MTYAEIAEKTGTTVEAVRDAMSRAKVVAVPLGSHLEMRRWVVPIEGVDVGAAVLGDGATKAEAVLAALSRQK